MITSDRPAKVALDSITFEGSSATQLVHGTEERPERFALFKASLFLRYPTARLHKPLVHFTASAVLENEAHSATSPDLDSEYMTSAVPESENLLANLIQSKPSTLSADDISLPASRLIKVSPKASTTNGDVRPLRASSKLIPILPILVMRVASTAAARMSEPVASMDLELTRYVNCSVEIQDISVSSNRLHAECLTESLQSSLVLHPGDRSTLMYRLRESGDYAVLAQYEQTLEVEIHATVQLTDSCKPRLKAQWRGNVSPFFTKGSNHWRRPMSASYMPSQDNQGSRPVSKRISMTGRPLSAFGNDLGVTLSFTGPPSVKNGETFYLDIFIVNRSARRKRLAIIAIPHTSKSTQSSHSGHRPLSTSTSAQSRSRDIAEAVTDSKSLFDSQHIRQHYVAEVVCLNADVRIGYVCFSFLLQRLY